MTPQRFAAAGFAVLAMLVGCGTVEQDQEGALSQVRAVAQTLSRNKAAAAPVPELGRAELAAFNVPVVQVNSSSGVAYLVPLKRNVGGADIWATGSQQTMTLRGGQITMTRGFGAFDVIESVVPQDMRGAVGQNYTRSYTTLDGADQPIREVMTCDSRLAGGETITIKGRAHVTQRIHETCVSEGKTFENDYWLDASGVRKLHQYMGNAIGYVTVSRVID